MTTLRDGPEPGETIPRRMTWAVLGAVVLLAAVTWASPPGTMRLAGISAATAALAILLLVRLRPRGGRRAGRKLARLARAFEEDPVPTFVSDGAGWIGGANPAAEAVGPGSTSMSQVLSRYVADGPTTCRRLAAKATSDGSASTGIKMPTGSASLTVWRHSKGLVWRIGERLAPSDGNDPNPTSLYFSTGRGGVILHMSEALRDRLGARPRAFDDLIERAAEGHVTLSGDESGALYDLEEGPRTGGRRQHRLIPLRAPAAPAGPTADLDDAFAMMPVALVAIGEGGMILSGNARAKELLASELEDGRLLREVVGGLGRSVDDWVREAFEGRGLGHPEVLKARRPDKEVFVQITFSRATRAGQPVLVAHLNDATEFKTLEAQFVQGQKMQAIGQLAGGVAHDFNNLLTAISGHCDLLMLRHDQHDPDYADLVQINQNANRAAALVSQLLAFSRKQNMQPEILDMRDTLADLTHLLNRLVGERVALRLQHADRLGSIRADKRQLEQVLMNLVVNARDALGGAGEIVIETRDLTLDEPLLRDNAEVAPGRYVEMRVCDHGCGIPADRLPKIFEPFFTTKRPGEGTGLGLSTVYGIVKQTGGFIFVDSEEGKGTTFQLLFPLHTAAPTAPAPGIERDTGAPGSGVVLLVEDEAPVRNFAARALQLQGYQVLEAEDAEAALSLLEDADLRVDLFVTDVIMPGMDGPTWVRRARKDRPDVGVVFVSGYAEDALDGAAATVPGSVFLPKPFSLNGLVETVGKQMAGRSAGSPVRPAAEAPPDPDLLTAAATPDGDLYPKAEETAGMASMVDGEAVVPTGPEEIEVSPANLRDADVERTSEDGMNDNALTSKEKPVDRDWVSQALGEIGEEASSPGDEGDRTSSRSNDAPPALRAPCARSGIEGDDVEPERASLEAEGGEEVSDDEDSSLESAIAAILTDASEQGEAARGAASVEPATGEQPSNEANRHA